MDHCFFFLQLSELLQNCSWGSFLNIIFNKQSVWIVVAVNSENSDFINFVHCMFTLVFAL